MLLGNQRSKLNASTAHNLFATEASASLPRARKAKHQLPLDFLLPFDNVHRRLVFVTVFGSRHYLVGRHIPNGFSRVDLLAVVNDAK